MAFLKFPDSNLDSKFSLDEKLLTFVISCSSVLIKNKLSLLKLEDILYFYSSNKILFMQKNLLYRTDIYLFCEVVSAFELELFKASRSYTTSFIYASGLIALSTQASNLFLQ